MSFQINCGQIEETNTSAMPFLEAMTICPKLRCVEVTKLGSIEGMPRAFHTSGFSQRLCDSRLDPTCSPCTDIFF